MIKVREKPHLHVNSTREMSRIERGHLELLVDVSKSSPLYEPIEFKTARSNLSYSLKVNEFADIDNQ